MLGDSLRRRHGAGDAPPAEGGKTAWRAPRRPGSGPRFQLAWWQWLVAALVVLGGSFLAGYLISTQILFPRPDIAGAGVAVPPLYGESMAGAQSELREVGLEMGEVTELASMETPPGRVLAQDPIPGQLLRPGASVSFAVSAGPPELRVPPLRGMSVASARELLESVGFTVAIRQVETGSVREGLVAGSAPEAGEARPLPAVVTLLVSAGPPMDTIPAPLSPVGEAGL